MDKEKEQKQVLSNKSKQDRFSELMFGRTPAKQNDQPSNDQANQNEVPKEQVAGQEVDYVQIMTQLDSIMGSINQLKPMIKQLSPILKYFKK